MMVFRKLSKENKFDKSFYVVLYIHKRLKGATRKQNYHISFNHGVKVERSLTLLSVQGGAWQTFVQEHALLINYFCSVYRIEFDDH